MLHPTGRPPIGKWELFLARRRDLGLTQSQVAKRLDVLQSRVSALESMQTFPDWLELPKLADFLNMSPEELASHIAKIFLPVVVENRPIYRKLR